MLLSESPAFTRYVIPFVEFSCLLLDSFKYLIGSTAFDLFIFQRPSWTSKCRCCPVECPVFPITPIACPCLTFVPETTFLDPACMCAYTVSHVFPLILCKIIMHSPSDSDRYDLLTVPAAD